jgi:hypothetical protein
MTLKLKKLKKKRKKRKKLRAVKKAEMIRWQASKKRLR